MHKHHQFVELAIVLIVFAVFFNSPAGTVSLTPNEEGVPEEIADQIAGKTAGGLKMLDPQDREISLFFAGSALWQGMNGVCGDGGNYMYGYPFMGLQVVDISNPSSPQIIAQFRHPGEISEMAFDGNYIYVAGGYEAGFTIFDVTDPYHPELASSIMSINNRALVVQSVEIIGTTAYVSCGWTYLIVDISNPWSPQILQMIEPDGQAYGSFVKDTFAYIATGYALELWDIGVEPTPVYIGRQTFGNASYGIGGHDGVLYLTDSREGLYVITTGTYGWPSLRGIWVDTVNTYRKVEAVGDYAYLQGYDSIKIIDTRNVSEPVLAADLPTEGFTTDISVSGNRAYLADWAAGMSAYDISSPVAPALEARLESPGMGSDLALAGNFGYEANGLKGLQVLDLSTPENPVPVANFLTPASAWAVATVGNAVYLSDETPALNVIDVSDPYSPALVETIPTPTPVRDIIVDGGYAYMVGRGDSLLIFEVSDPLSPAPVARVFVGGWCEFMTVRGDYAYLSVSDVGVQVFDISDPASPSLTGTCPIAGNSYGIGLVGDYAYVSHGYVNDLEIVDISDPANPTLAVELPRFLSQSSSWIRNMVMIGDYLYVAAYLGGFQIYNVSNPLTPYLAGEYVTEPLWCWDVDVAGEYIYLTCDNGFLVLQQSDCSGPDGTGGFNIADAVYLIHYIFTGGPAPAPLDKGDLNCDGAVNLGDAVYLIDFIFRSGQPPCGGCY